MLEGACDAVPLAEMGACVHELKTLFGSPVMAFLKSRRETMLLLLLLPLPWTDEPWVTSIKQKSRNSSCSVRRMASFLVTPLEPDTYKRFFFTYSL
jgi:hypothetical protein